MIKVGETAAEIGAAPASIGAHGLMLPASFDGDLPCADCAGIRYRVNLWSDQVFHMRRTWLGKDMRRDSIGRWSVDPDQHVLELRGADEDLSFRILGSDRLELLARDDAAGGNATGGGSVERNLLTAAAALEPFEPHLPLRGMLTYMGDDARFTECVTGRDYPLIQDGDYEALEHAYLAAGAEPGGPIMASFDGGIVRMPKRVRGQVGHPGRAVRGGLAGRDLRAHAGRRDADQHLLEDPPPRRDRGGGRRGQARAQPDPARGRRRFTATVGCQPIAGSYRLSQDRLQMAPTTTDARPAPPPSTNGRSSSPGRCRRPPPGASTARRSSSSTPARRRSRCCRRCTSTEPTTRGVAGRRGSALGSRKPSREDSGMGEIGRTGVRAPKIGFGTSGLGSMPDTYGYAVSEERARDTVRAVLALPDGMIDSSRNYGSGRSEERIGQVVARARRLAGRPRALDQARPRHGDRPLRRRAGPPLARGEPRRARRSTASTSCTCTIPSTPPTRSRWRRRGARSRSCSG